jgi:hypothetical protein
MQLAVEPTEPSPDSGVTPDAAEAATAAQAADSGEERQEAAVEAEEAQAADVPADDAPQHEAAPEPDRPAPPLLRFRPGSTTASPAVDAYSLRLVATRKLYDLGTDAQQSPGLAALTGETSLRLHPHDFDRLGITAGTLVTATSSKGSASLPVHPDGDVGKGSALVTLHQPGATVGALIDATERVTEIRVEKS